MKRYQAIFFDAGYTLLYVHPSSGEVVAGICRGLGLDLDPVRINEVLREAYRAAREETYRQGDFSTSPEKTRAFWFGIHRRALMELGVRSELNLCCEVILAELQQSKYYRLFPDVLPTLHWLKHEGYGLGVISNFDPSLVDLLKDLGVACYFNHFFISSLVGVEKPDPKIFEVAIKKVGLSPKKLLMVGDDLLADVQAAQAVGMRGVLLDRRNRYEEAGGGIDRCPRIKNLLGLKSLLGPP